MYRYAANNPVKYTDPDGRQVFWIGLGQGGWSHDAPQNNIPYTDDMDTMALFLGFNLDATKFATDQFTLRLWKGNYGGLKYVIAQNFFLSMKPILGATALIYGGCGGEIGLYNPDNTCMNRENLQKLGMVGSRIEVIDKKSGNMISWRTEKEASFWTTTFSWFSKLGKKNIYTNNILIFDTEEDASRFYGAIMDENVYNNAKKYSHNRGQVPKIYLDENDKKRLIITWGLE